MSGQNRVAVVRGTAGLPLMRLIKDNDWQTVETRINSKSGELEASKGDFMGTIPLHVACCERAPLDIIRALLQIYPNGVKTPGQWGALPIHAACTKSSAQTVRMILDAYPDGAKQPCRKGRIPLHCAYLVQNSVDVIKTIVDAFPAGAAKPDRTGLLPIHMEFSRQEGPRAEVIAKLIDANPDGVRMREKKGMSWSVLFLRRPQRPAEE